MRTMTIASIFAAFAASLPAWGQPQSDEAKLDAALADLRAVETSFATDRSEYLPGEVIGLTLTARNPTAVARTIPKAFADLNWFRIFRLESDGKRIPVGAEPEAHGGTFARILWGTERLGPGASSDTRAFSDQLLHAEAGACPLAPFCAAPRDPGTYEVDYTYGATTLSARFRVLEGVRAGAEAAIKMPRNERDPESGMLLFTYRTAVELIIGGVSHLCVGRSDLRLLAEVSRPAELVTGNAYSPRAPLQRVLATTAGITNLQLEAASNGDLTVTWTDNQNRLQSLVFDAKLNRLR